MLSASSSFIATNCPDWILATSLAAIGGSVDDSTMGWLEVLGLVSGVDLGASVARM